MVPFGDRVHQTIDEMFGTECKEYGSVARNTPPPEALEELFKDLGKNVAFCFVPIPGSQLNKPAKIAKTAKAVYEAAKLAGVTQGVATVGSALTQPPTPTPVIQETPAVPQQQGNITVYRSINTKTNEVQYVGITNNFSRRQLEHWKSKE